MILASNAYPAPAALSSATIIPAMDNKAIAGILYETADLLEIDGQDSFRIRSYRNAAEAIEAMPQQVASLIGEPKKLLAVPGIGKGMLANLQHLFRGRNGRSPRRTAKEISPFDARTSQDPGLGAKDHRPYLERLPNLRS